MDEKMVEKKMKEEKMKEEMMVGAGEQEFGRSFGGGGERPSTC